MYFFYQINSDLFINKTTNVNYTNSSASDVQSLSIAKFNKLVVITFIFSATTTDVDKWLKILQLNDTSFRPTHEISFSFNDTNCKPMVGRILTDGTISWVQQQVGVFAARVCITYIV